MRQRNYISRCVSVSIFIITISFCTSFYIISSQLVYSEVLMTENRPRLLFNQTDVKQIRKTVDKDYDFLRFEINAKELVTVTKLYDVRIKRNSDDVVRTIAFVGFI